MLARQVNKGARMKKQVFILLIILFISISCGGNTEDRESLERKPVKKVSKNENDNKNTNNTEKQEDNKKKLDLKETFTYDSQGKNDPFKIEVESSSYGSVSGESGEYQFNFTRFKYKGMLSFGNEKKALIEDVNGKGIILKKGDAFGGAKVEEISKNEIILIKTYIESTGGSKKIILERVESKGGK